MTRLRLYPVLLCLTVTTPSCAHGSSGTLHSTRLAVNGVTVGSPRSIVIKLLGRPLAVEAGYDDVMGMGQWAKLTYHGLLVEVILPESNSVRNRRNEAYVASMVITDSSWRTASGLRVGDSSAVVQQLLGIPERTEPGDKPYWYYATAGFDGRVVVAFREDRVIEIRIEEDWS